MNILSGIGDCSVGIGNDEYTLWYIGDCSVEIGNDEFTNWYR